MQYIFNESVKIDWVKDIINKDNYLDDKYSIISFAKLLLALEENIGFTDEELEKINNITKEE
jgi:hypothetical protein